SSTQTSRSTTRVTQATPRPGITSAQTRSQINTPISKTEILTITKPSPSTVNTKNNRKESDETTDSSDEESSSGDDKSWMLIMLVQNDLLSTMKTNDDNYY
ncbi:unnamed protein product, partial [Rotaria sordida]